MLLNVLICEGRLPFRQIYVQCKEISYSAVNMRHESNQLSLAAYHRKITKCPYMPGDAPKQQHFLWAGYRLTIAVIRFSSRYTLLSLTLNDCLQTLVHLLLVSKTGQKV